MKQCCGTSVTGVMVFHEPFFLFVKMVFGTLSNTPVTQMYIINMYFNLLMSYNKYDRQSSCFALMSLDTCRFETKTENSFIVVRFTDNFIDGSGVTNTQQTG